MNLHTDKTTKAYNHKKKKNPKMNQFSKLICVTLLTYIPTYNIIYVNDVHIYYISTHFSINQTVDRMFAQ